MAWDENQRSFGLQSDCYAQARPRYPEVLFEYLSSLCERHHIAWDCATGSGQAAIALAQYFEHIKATDMSAEQIEHAFEHQAIDYSVQPAERTNFADQSFDLVMVAQALHWFDLDRFWPEVIRVLKPNGIFAAVGYSWPRVSDEIDTTFEQLVVQPIAEYWSEQNQLLWNDYQDIEFPFALMETPPFAISQTWTLNQFFEYIETWSAVKKYRQRRGGRTIDAAKQTLTELWPDNMQKIVSMSLCLKIGRAIS